jgi:hypothetical protein
MTTPSEEIDDATSAQAYPGDQTLRELLDEIAAEDGPFRDEERAWAQEQFG